MASQATYLKIFRHPAYPKLAMTTTSLAVQAVLGTRMVVYRPADEVTRDAIARLLAGEGTDARYPCWEAHQQRNASLGSTVILQDFPHREGESFRIMKQLLSRCSGGPRRLH